MAGTVTRYRIMALVSGTMSLLLWFLYVPVKAFSHDPQLIKYLLWIPLVHGYLYPIYILASIQFSLKARWPLVKVLGLILAGTLPIASFITERRVVRQYR